MDMVSQWGSVLGALQGGRVKQSKIGTPDKGSGAKNSEKRKSGEIASREIVWLRPKVRAGDVGGGTPSRKGWTSLKSK